MTIQVPAHFIPQPDNTATSTQPSTFLPRQVIDLFYIRPTTHQPTTLLAVLGTLFGGALMVAPAATFSHLPDSIRDQIQAVLVSRRSQVRTITTRELAIVSLEALEQHSQMRGFNDAITGYGRLQAVINTEGETTIIPFAQDGRLHLGRLDLLAAFQSGLADAFHNPQDASEIVHHFFVPMGVPASVAIGREVGLVYPLIYSDVMQRFDNSSFVLRIIYDLLLRLQREMADEQHPHFFTTLNLPVPNRQRVESELRSQNYRIKGDIASRDPVADEPSDANQPTSWLTKMRRFAKQWSAPRILLPPQATAADYAELIADVLPAILRAEDRAMVQAMNLLMTAAPAQGDLPRPAIVQTTPSSIPSILQSSPTPVTANTTANPSNHRLESTRDNRGDWAQDFADSPTYIRSSSLTKASTKRWWEDFHSETAEEAERQLTSGNEGDNAKLAPQPDTQRDANTRLNWSQDFVSKEA